MAQEDLDLDVEAEDEAGGKGGGLKIVLIAVVGVLLLSSTLMAILYFTGFFDSAEPEAAATEQAAPGEPAQAAMEQPRSQGSGPIIYQPLEPPFVVNFNSRETDVRFMQITIQVADRDPGVIDDVKTHSPAIRNSLVMLFGSQDPDVLVTREGKEDLRKMALKEVRSVLRQMTGRGELENLYFTSFVMQ